MERRLVIAMTALVVVATLTRSVAQAPNPPRIHISQPTPPWTTGGEGPIFQIAGTVEFAPDGAVVHVFCYAGGQWWIQPWRDDNTTSIAKSSWHTDTHGGEVYAALLTRSSWKAPATLADLPLVGEGVLAIDKVAGKK